MKRRSRQLFWCTDAPFFLADLLFFFVVCSGRNNGADEAFFGTVARRAHGFKHALLVYDTTSAEAQVLAAPLCALPVLCCRLRNGAAAFRLQLWRCGCCIEPIALVFVGRANR